MNKKYVVQHVGRPYAPSESIPDDAWHTLSTHASEKAAWKRIANQMKYLSPGSWDDHYRVIAPNGIICSYGEYIDREAFSHTQKWR